MSLGFDSLPASFWEKSSLYRAAPADAPYKKNTHASAWHMDLDQDVALADERRARTASGTRRRTTSWATSTTHELQPPRGADRAAQGANRAYHEGIGSMIGLASSQRRFLAGPRPRAAGRTVDSMAQLLSEALQFVVFIPFAAGTMTHGTKDFYAGATGPAGPGGRRCPPTRSTRGGGSSRAVPGHRPARRPARRAFTDAATKTHINDDPAQYYDYALSYALLFQLHDHIATTDPRTRTRTTPTTTATSRWATSCAP